MTISTWGQDCARGLDHPDSVEAREQRKAAAYNAENDRKSKFYAALRAIGDNLKNEQDVALVLYATSSALAKHHGPESYLHPVVTKLDELADSIEYREGV